MCIFKFKKNISYEKTLLKKYGKCKKITNGINILVFSDTHNKYAYNTEELNEVKNLN